MSGLADTCLFPVLGRNQQDNGLGQAAPCNHPAPEGTQRRAASRSSATTKCQEPGAAGPKVPQKALGKVSTKWHRTLLSMGNGLTGKTEMKAEVKPCRSLPSPKAPHGDVSPVPTHSTVSLSLLHY